MPEALTTGILVGLAAIFGLLIGSFLNVCIYRLPAGITIVRGHSFCPNCKHSLGSLDLVPVFSYLFLGRRCRYCQKPISSRYARIELLTGAYFALAAWCLQPGRFIPPDWLKAALVKTDAVLQASLLSEAGVVLIAAACLAFCGLLVWAMIIWDGKRVPGGIYIFTLIPVLLRLALQPGRLAGHLIAMILCLLLFFFFYRLQLLPESTPAEQKQLGAGLLLLGLMAGFQAIQPVLAILVIELMLLNLQSGRGRVSRRSRGSRTDQEIDSRAVRLWRSLPLQALLVGSIAWLIF